MKIIIVILLAAIGAQLSTDKMVTVRNFHVVSSELYRSAQPSAQGMKELEILGVKTILNLRLRRSDKKEIKGTKLNYKWVKIPTKRMSYTEMVSAMQTFDKAEKPVLVHCRRGSDRTGCFVACYRILYENWDKQRALDSLLGDGKGYYENLFPNLKQFVKDLDTAKFRRDVFK